MMQDSFEAKIIRVDGLSHESLTCRVFHNSRQFEEFRPLAQQRSFQLSGGGIFTFSFKSGQIQKSVSLKLSLFLEDGAHWLPLFEKNTFLEELPQETSAPRFLIVLCQNKALHVIEETLEMLEESSLNVSESDNVLGSDCQSTFTNDLLESLPSELLEHNSFDDEHCEDTFCQANNEKLSRIWDKETVSGRNSVDSLKEESFACATVDLVHKYEKILSELQIQIIKNEENEEKILKLVQNFNDQVSRSQTRENSLIELVQAKETEAKQARSEISDLKLQVQKLELENKRLTDVNSGLSNQLAISAPVLAELQSLRSKVHDLQRRSFEEFELRTSESTVNHLPRSSHKSKHFEFDSKESQNSSISIDELEDAVRTQAKLMNLPESLVRDKEQMYVYGTRKISLVLVNGGLMCRAGVSFQPFQDYMQNFILDTTAVKPLKKRFSVDKNIDSEYDEENFRDLAKVQRNPSRGLRKCCLKKK